jgi:hypothetical protein
MPAFQLSLDFGQERVTTSRLSMVGDLESHGACPELAESGPTQTSIDR